MSSTHMHICGFALIVLAQACADRPSHPVPTRPQAQGVVPAAPHGAVSREAEIETLVLQLRSPAPPKHPDYYFATSPFLDPGELEDPRVSDATDKLVALGPSAYSVLAKHREDREYSYSANSSTWINKTVGVRVMEILTHELDPCGGGYEAAKVEERRTLLGYKRRPTGYEYLDERGFENWVRESAPLARREVRTRYVRWYVKREKHRGFVSRSQQHEVLDGCLQELAPPTAETPPNLGLQQTKASNGR